MLATMRFHIDLTRKSRGGKIFGEVGSFFPPLFYLSSLPSDLDAPPISSTVRIIPAVGEIFLFPINMLFLSDLLAEQCRKNERMCPEDCAVYRAF